MTKFIKKKKNNQLNYNKILKIIKLKILLIDINFIRIYRFNKNFN